MLIVNLHDVAKSMRVILLPGEMLSLRIVREGKDKGQGVGYLPDGTMVVVNGGGEFLGQSIRTQVLSQKYSSSGKIIFCNAIMLDDRSPARALTEGTPYTTASVL